MLEVLSLEQLTIGEPTPKTMRASKKAARYLMSWQYHNLPGEPVPVGAIVAALMESQEGCRKVAFSMMVGEVFDSLNRQPDEPVRRVCLPEPLGVFACKLPAEEQTLIENISKQ